MSKKIFWIASYPKSGNTWMRAILSALFYTKDGKFNFTLFKLIGMFETFEKFEYIKKINIEDYEKLSDLKILSKYWLQTQKNINIIKGQSIFLKTHHACISYMNNPFTTPEISDGVIYIVRDPRDVVISYSKHAGISLEEQIHLIKKQSFYPYTSPSKKLLGILSPWDEHIQSWEYLNVPKLFIKYEDMLENLSDVLFKIVNFFEKNYNISFQNIENKIQNIINSTSFNNMANKEKTRNFNETLNNSNFFRIGKKNQWKKILSTYQINLIESSFKSKMKKFEYI